MKRVKRPIKSNVQIPPSKDKIFSQEDISTILNIVKEKTGCIMEFGFNNNGITSLVIDDTIYSFSE